MGTWAPGLYSDDFACDLRSLVASLARLPFHGDEILAELRRIEMAADQTDDEKHTVFRLVTADQLFKRGIACETAMSKARSIIESGRDLAVMRDLGMSPHHLNIREKQLTKLATAWRGPPPKSKPRKVLSKPQPFLLEVGSVWMYPTSGGRPRNPYFMRPEDEGFDRDGWGAMIVLARGCAFGWLAWYAVAPISIDPMKKPGLLNAIDARYFAWSGSLRPAEIAAIRKGEAPAPIDGGMGSLSATHLKRMQLERLGIVNIQPDWWRSRFPNAPWCTQIGASNISISNYLDLTLRAREGCLVVDSLSA